MTLRPGPLAAYRDSSERVRPTRRVESFTQSTDQARPVNALVRLVTHRPRAQGSLTESGCPVSPTLTCGIDHHNLEHGAVFVDGHEPFPAFAADLELEPRDTAHGALVVMGKDPFHQRMPGGEEVDGFFLYRLLAVERADVARSASDARKTVNQRPAANLNREDPMASRTLDGEPEPGAGRHHDFFVERVELHGYAGEDPRGHVSSIRIAMKHLIRGFADTCARRVGFADQFIEPVSRQRGCRIECDLLERALDMGQLGLQPGQGFAEETKGLEEPYHVRADAGRRTEVHDVHRDAPADAIEPADPLLHDRGFPGQVEQHQAVAELEVATLAS